MICDRCRPGLEACVEEGLLSAAQWDAIRKRTSWVETGPAPEAETSFNVVMVAYYFGALLILSAFGWFMGSQWDALGPGGIFIVSLLYAALFGIVGRHLLRAENYPVAGGLLITCCVGMTPLATYAVQAWTGIWPGDAPPGGYHGYYVWINGSWIVIELATVAAALAALRKVKFSFLVMPAAIALWFFSMDVAEIVLRERRLAWEARAWVSVVCGAAFLGAGRFIDRRSEGVDYAFWVYLAGLLAFWGGLTALPSKGELGRALYCAANLGLIAASLYLDRRTFAVFGAIGVYVYLGHLAFSVFRDSPLFPVALAFLGIMMILSTVFFQKNYSRLRSFLRAV